MQGVAPAAELFVDMSVVRTVCCKGFTAVVWKMGDECDSVFCLFFFLSLFLKTVYYTKTWTNISVSKDFVFLYESSEQRVDSKASQPFAARCYRCYWWRLSSTTRRHNTENERCHFGACLVPDGVLKTGRQTKKNYNSLLAFCRNTHRHTQSLIFTTF